MRCSDCGGEIQGRYDFCPHCGFSITGRMRPVPQQLRKKRGMSGITIIIIVVVVVVVVPMILAATLYYMTLGFGGGTVEPTTLLAAAGIPGGVKMTFSAESNIDIIWSDVTILLSDGVTTATWALFAEDLDGGSAVTAAYGSRSVGGTVFLNVTDITGNAYVNQGDYFTLTGSLSTASTYTVTLVYDPTASEICHRTFAV